ncbi:MAG: GNAT family N-acetyltransferase [Pyrinomonadaceae bacterium]|nr:GNAT family N-acetyltransferase [Pyrinomonadaceae bacterium]
MQTAVTLKNEEITYRKVEPADAASLGNICYEAFETISATHNFPKDFPNAEVATGLISMLAPRSDVFSIAAVASDGTLLGSNFLWEADSVGGVGPVTVDPALQNSGIGRELMRMVLDRADDRGLSSVRLVQAAFHNRSLALYAKLGFDTVEPLSNVQGAPIRETMPGYDVRLMTENDIPFTSELAFRIHGHDRQGEVSRSVQMGTGMVVEHNGRITGYTTGVGFFGHSVGETNNDLRAMIAAADGFPGPGFLLPTRNGELLRWCLEKGLRIVQPLTLMSRGMYQEPRGAFLPSILY